MAKEGPNWDGLLKWSIAHSDGTGTARKLSEDDRKWFMEAMQAQTIDVVKRMKEITLVMQTPDNILEEQGVTSTDLEDMLDELQEHVESIDMANDLHSIGGLTPLLNYLKNSHANIRAKAAEVVSTIVQNNPKSQQLVMDANGMEPLLSNFTSDDDVTSRTKALGAISSLIRHNKPGIQAFRLANGYAALRDALSSESVRFQRKALNLIQYLLQENPSDCNVVTELGFPRILRHLAASEDAEVRESALSGLHELAKVETVVEKDDEKFKQVLKDRINDISNMSLEDLAAVREERQLVDSLWTAYYNEPSSLREKGLVVLPEDEDDAHKPPPDVASKVFESPLRPPQRPTSSNDEKSKSDKKEGGESSTTIPFLPVFSSMKLLMRYSLGSIAIGSLIVSFIESTRFILEAIRKRLKVADIMPENFIKRSMFHTSRFCLKGIELTLKSVNRNAYIMIAITGKGFFKASEIATNLIISNILRIGRVNVIGDVILFLGKLCVSLASALFAFLMLDTHKYKSSHNQITSPLFPVMVCWGLGYVVATLFFGVVEMSIDTIILSYCQDAEEHQGTAHYAPPLLIETFEEQNEVQRIGQ